MTAALSKKRKLEEGTKSTKKSKNARKQQDYHSSSSSEDGANDFHGADLVDSSASENSGIPSGPIDTNTTYVTSENFLKAQDSNATSDSDLSNASSASSSQSHPSKKRKRNDPDAFATSMSKILSSKLSTLKRSDPVLSRSKTAALASQELSNSRLEAKARRKLREDRKTELDKGRVRDILGLESASTAVHKDHGAVSGDGTVSVGEIAEQERRLRKTAQRGVVKLFNAVRAAQVKAEEASREARKQGVVGLGRREEKVSEMSKKGFLDLIVGGGENRKDEAAAIKDK